VTQTCSFEGFHLCVASTAWSVANETNLVARDLISPEAHFCVSGCGGSESAKYLFLSCNTFGSLWALIHSWIGFSAVDTHILRDHLVRFTYSVGGLRARRSLLLLIWLACVWVVWNERNLRLYHNVASPVHHMLEKIKLLSFRWLKTTNVTIDSNYHSWWSNLFLCLGID
jgi:hypothetical protein